MKFVLFNGLFLLITGQGTANPVLLNSNHQGLTFQADLSGRCPAGYSQPDNSNWTYCYQVFSDFQTPKDAASQCKADNGSLASIPSSLVNSFIYYLATQVDATSVWLGVECFNGDKTACMNSDGTPFNYSSFKSGQFLCGMSCIGSGQPDPTENCVYMSAAGRDAQDWSTFDCQQKFAYACEKAAGVIVSTPTCPNGYTEFQVMCYKFVHLGYMDPQISADSAAAECRKIPGGNLATVGNNATNEFLTSVERSAGFPNEEQPIGPLGAFGMRCYNVGYNGDRSSCRWDDGTPFGFSGFHQNFPIINANGCCYFRLGVWYGCDDCDTQNWNAYHCQAPKQ